MCAWWHKKLAHTLFNTVGMFKDTEMCISLLIEKIFSCAFIDDSMVIGYIVLTFNVQLRQF